MNELKEEIKSANSLIGNKKLNTKIKEATADLDCKSIKERTFCVLNDVTKIPKCSCCSKQVRFDKLKNEYSRFCSLSCYSMWRKENKLFRTNTTNEKLLKDKDNYVQCKVCGSAVKSIASHVKLSGDDIHKNWDLERYKKEFPNEPIIAKNTSKILSEKSKGENNAMHSSKTTKEFRQSISPFSIEFYKRKFSNESLEQQEKRLKEFISTVDYDSRLTESQLDYWIEKCNGDVEQAKELYKERQSTFTKEKCIKKYGEEKGLEVYNDRQEKWSIIMEEKYQNGEYHRSNGSNISSLNYEIVEYLPKTKYCLENEWFIHTGKRIYYYDYKLGNKIIEFNGDYWHCNPEIYESTFYNKSKQMYAQEIWNFEVIKLQAAKDNGFEVLTIWESDFKKHKKETLQRCVDFLKE